MALGAALLAFPVTEGAAQKRDRSLPRGKTWTWTFAADTLGQAPTATRAHGGTWQVVSDSTAATMPEGGDAAPRDSSREFPRLLRQVEAEDGITFHYLQFLKPRLDDLEISVRFRIRSGEIDPTAGIAFHLDPKGRNGYVVRVSGTSGELIAHYLLHGRRRDIKYAKVAPPEAGTWHTLGVRRIGAQLDVIYDGAAVLRLRDERFTGGNVGLWTEDDTVVDFADLTARSL
jgi:hypothetical protein